MKKNPIKDLINKKNYHQKQNVSDNSSEIKDG